MARKQLQNICVDNAATSFLGEQLVAQWPSFFKKKKKSVSCSEVSAGSCCFIIESCHIFYGAKLCRRSWETKMKENWCTIWIGASEQRVMVSIKLSIYWEWRVHSPLTFGAWTLAPFQMPGGTITLSGGFIGGDVIWSWLLGAISGGWSVQGEWTQMKRLWLWKKIRNYVTDSLDMRNKSQWEYFPHGQRHKCNKKHLLIT